MVYLVQIQCQWCGLLFCLCRRCYRGQAYCSEGCRKAKRVKAHREAQYHYRQTDQGRRAHREAERRRRMRKKRKSVDDRTSTPRCLVYTIESLGNRTRIRGYYPWKIRTGRKGRCHFCGASGRIVEKFPRRGYGRYG
jgi:hypothetical protein